VVGRTALGNGLCAQREPGSHELEELQALSSLDNIQATLERALQAANAAIFARGQMPNPLTAGMGATIVALLAAGERIMLAHVGDSRAYRLDRRGALHRLTKDHSVVQRMIDNGVLTEAEAANHPDASVLERALGQTPRVAVEVSGWIELQHGDVCMLCSDGLCGYVDDSAIATVMRESGTPQAIADRLVRLALDAGGEDNVTVEVMRCGDSRGTRVRRWFGRAALALAAVCAAAAAMVSQGMFGLGLRERPVTKVAPVASVASVVSVASAPDEAASLDKQIAAKQHELDDLKARRAALAHVATSAPVAASSTAASSVNALARQDAQHSARPAASQSTKPAAPDHTVRNKRTASQPSEKE
jgi:serine/threonine protein phosphatase PrpC